MLLGVDIASEWTYNSRMNVQTDAREVTTMYQDKLLFDENKKDERTGFVVAIPDHGYLRHQREAMGMTQKEVADAAGILLRQYQRLESGERSMCSASLRIGLAVCDVLKLDPHRFIPSNS